MSNFSSARPHVIKSTQNLNLNNDEPFNSESSEEKIAALTELICGAGAETSAALFVLMAMLQDSPDPRAFANRAKHLAFARCGEFNVYDMVDAQIAVLERKLLAGL